jgi:hypothetical protein
MDDHHHHVNGVLALGAGRIVKDACERKNPLIGYRVGLLATEPIRPVAHVIVPKSGCLPRAPSPFPFRPGCVPPPCTVHC